MIAILILCHGIFASHHRTHVITWTACLIKAAVFKLKSDFDPTFGITKDKFQSLLEQCS